MPWNDKDALELETLQRPPGMEVEESEAGPSSDHLDNNTPEEENTVAADKDHLLAYGSSLDRRTKQKLDCILLPFLALLFLLNSLDKSNVGNAETAGFTRDAGLAPEDLNISMSFFFAFFVALQPVGAALGRKFGMARYVPACMSLWGLCTLLHIWISKKWQLILLRIAIATLEAGFYPTTVSYLSLFYTRYEFAVRLGIFYGQTAVAGVVGGFISWAVFSRFDYGSSPGAPPTVRQVDKDDSWKSWEVLFLIEGYMTMTIALIGFFWLPHSAETAWFFTDREKQWAEQRIKLDRDDIPTLGYHQPPHVGDDDDDNDYERGEAHHRLLSDAASAGDKSPANSNDTVTADAGLSRQDILSAFLNYKIWHILVVNIFSAIPATAFGVFLPLVVKQLSPSLNLAPAASNLLATPPFACGAVMLFIFTRWSDHSKRRFVPILWGLGILLVGLTATVLIPMNQYGLRYAALCVLLSGSFIASPLTVAWLTNNTPEPGKRAILLGINGWGNLAGVFLGLLFTPEDEKNGYIRPFIITLLCVLASFAGYIALWIMLVRENKRRDAITTTWSDDEKEREELSGDMPVPSSTYSELSQTLGLDTLARRLGSDGRRRGDDKMTFKYGL